MRGLPIAACLGAVACGGSPTGPSNSGGGSSGGGTSGGGTTASCRTAATSTRSVQTFVTGVVVTTDSSCTFNAGTNEVGCQMTSMDSVGGPGTGTQTTRFASRSDLVDEVAVVPPVSRALGTTTQTYDQNGVIIREVCTGTTASTTVVTVNSTQQVCK